MRAFANKTTLTKSSKSAINYLVNINLENVSKLVLTRYKSSV